MNSKRSIMEDLRDQALESRREMVEWGDWYQRASSGRALGSAKRASRDCAMTAAFFPLMSRVSRTIRRRLRYGGVQGYR